MKKESEHKMCTSCYNWLIGSLMLNYTSKVPVILFTYGPLSRSFDTLGLSYDILDKFIHASIHYQRPICTFVLSPSWQLSFSQSHALSVYQFSIELSSTLIILTTNQKYLEILHYIFFKVVIDLSYKSVFQLSSSCAHSCKVGPTACQGFFGLLHPCMEVSYIIDKNLSVLASALAKVR